MSAMQSADYSNTNTGIAATQAFVKSLKMAISSSMKAQDFQPFPTANMPCLPQL